MILVERPDVFQKDRIVEKNEKTNIVYYTKKVPEFNVIHNIITDCWVYDNELIDKWHIKAGSGFRECVKDTMNTLINETNDTFEFIVLVDKSDKNVIGFFASELIKYLDYDKVYHLTTFYVKPAYRTREFMTTYSNDISDNIRERTINSISSFWLSTVWVKNKKATSWFKRLGGKPIARFGDPKGDVVVYGFGYK
jgi:hypothetical protein